MQIQYAVFCEKIETKTLPPTFQKPISNFILKDIKNIEELSFPLFVTLVDGVSGQHTIKVKITTPTRTIAIPDYTFNWRGGKTQGEILSVNFQPDIYGMYIFTITVDNKISHSVPIPCLAPK